jgi:heat shock protein HspQ
MPCIESSGKFHIGQVVVHRRFGYRAVIYDVDPSFMLNDERYRALALAEPPADQPWYRLLVDGVEHATYVAERNLVGATNPEPIQHPLIDDYFGKFDGLGYEPALPRN